MRVTGWKVEGDDRQRLLVKFDPVYANVVADHVTLQAKVPAEANPPPHVECAVVGRADDGKGVECLVVTIDGTTDRPDGSTFHITWSLAPGRRAVESNDVLRDRGWEAIPEPIPVALKPAVF